MRTRRARLALAALEDRTVPVAGALDPAFDGDGKATVVSFPGQADQENDLCVQADGKLVLAGTAAAFTPVTSPLLIRLNPNGAYDTSFAGDGSTYVTIPGGGRGSFNGVRQQADGRLLAVGTADLPSTGHGHLMLARFHPNGALDASFDGDGLYFHPVPGSGRALALQPDGKILATGNPGPDFALYRFHPDGSPDASFGQGGTAALTGTSVVVPSAVLVEPDDKVVVAGGSVQGGFAVLRFHPDGSPDTGFGANGLTVTRPPDTQNQGIEGLVRQPDGRLVAAGGCGLGAGNSPTPVLLRYNPDGTLDTSLAGTGYVISYLDSGAGSFFGAVAVQPDGKPVAVGTLGVPGGSKSMAVRYNVDGSFDAGFGPAGQVFQPGIVVTDMAGGDNDGFTAVALLPDGRIVAGGTVGGGSVQSLGVARYLGDPLLAAADQYATDEDAPLSVPAPGVQANDTIPATAQAELVQGPTNAAAFGLNADGSFDYTPAADFHGTDTFTYRLVSGTLASSPATVTVTVDPVNDLPFAADNAYGLPRLTPFALTVPAAQGVLANDTDADGDALHAVLVTPPAEGTLDLRDDGSFTYTFPKGLIGPVTFTYKVNDGTADGTTATVTLTRPADQAPTSGADDYDLPRVAPLDVPAAQGVLANDADPDGDPMTAVLVVGPATGTLDLRADGSFTFTYPAGLTGSVTFTYRATDGRADGPVTTVTLTMPPNFPPAAADDAYVVPFAGPLVVPAASGLLANDTDAEGDAIIPTLVSQPSAGTVTLNSDGSFSYTFPDDLAGSVTFTYKVADTFGEGNTATVTLTRQGFVDLSAGTLTVVGTGGTDVVRLRPAGTGVSVEIQSPLGLTRQVLRPAAGTPKLTRVAVYLGPGDDRLDGTALRLPVRAVGGAGADVLRTGRGPDTVFGDETDGTGTGADLIETGAGHDTVTAGAGGSMVDAGSGNDQVTVAGGNNWVQGGAGKDVLVGGTGADLLDGGAGRDLLVGGLGADLLEGGGGADILFDGIVAVNDPVNDSLARVLAAFTSRKVPLLAALTARLTVSADTGAADTLTGGSGTDWFWSSDPLDALDLKGTEPKNAVA